MPEIELARQYVEEEIKQTDPVFSCRIFSTQLYTRKACLP